MTDIKNLAPGDVVHVREVVHEIIGDSFRPEGSREWTMKYQIVHVEPRPLKVGDSVRIRGNHVGYTLIGIDGSDGWLRTKEGGRFTWELSYLERVNV